MKIADGWRSLVRGGGGLSLLDFFSLVFKTGLMAVVLISIWVLWRRKEIKLHRLRKMLGVLG